MPLSVSFFLGVLAFWFFSAVFYEVIFDYLGSYANVSASKVHEGKGDAYVNSAMFLSIEDEG